MTTNTEHPERERLAKILRDAASAWWSGEELLSPMSELEHRHWIAWANAILALLRPEAASPPPDHEGFVEARSVGFANMRKRLDKRRNVAASPPEGRPTLFGVPIVESDAVPLGEIALARLPPGWAVVPAASVDRGLVERIEALEELLERCRDALDTLPQDCLGDGIAEFAASDTGEAAEMRWPIRDELIDNINRALERVPDARAGEVT